jgi:hypothetical protein
LSYPIQEWRGRSWDWERLQKEKDVLTLPV